METNISKKKDLGDSLKVYAQNELDHAYILDRQTAYLWKVEPETCAIAKFSLQWVVSCLRTTQTLSEVKKAR